MFSKNKPRIYVFRVLMTFILIGFWINTLRAGGHAISSPIASQAMQKPTWELIQVIFVIVIFVIIAVILWNRSLQARVAHQTRELARELIARKEAEEQVRTQNQEMLSTYKALQSSYGTVALMAKELAASQKNLLAINTQLTSTNTLYRSVFNSSSNAILLLDINKLSIVDANRAAESLTGYTLDELRSMSVLSLGVLPRQNALQVLEEQKFKILRDGSSVLKAIGKSRSGEEIPVRVHLSFVPHENSELILAIIFDLSDQVKQEQEREKLIRYQQEAEKMTTLSIMSAGVVHEIAQPLNAIKILADGALFWQENGRKIELSEAFDIFRKISIQAERINDVIVHMRNLANTFDDSDLSPCDVNEAINDAVRLLRSQLASHGISLEMDLDPDIPPALGQKQRLEEILLNLVTNAMRALNDHEGEKTITCSTGLKDDLILIEVADTGPGISPEIADHIWEPFFSTHQDSEGMGLGLVIVHSIVSRLGGGISYYQNQWGGATFRILLPILKPNQNSTDYI